MAARHKRTLGPGTSVFGGGRRLPIVNISDWQISGTTLAGHLAVPCVIAISSKGIDFFSGCVMGVITALGSGRRGACAPAR